MMQTKRHSIKFLRQRKFLLALPLLIIPFITLGFWALGGGKGNGARVTSGSKQGGLNTELPGAYLKDENPLDKLAYYEKAQADSAKIREFIKKDPYLKTKTQVFEDTGNLVSNNQYKDPNEEKVYKKLAQLNSVLNQPQHPALNEKQLLFTSDPNLRKIDPALQTLNSKEQMGSVPDPELKQLSGMLDKILDIQHPERINSKTAVSSALQQEQVYPVSSRIENNKISLLGIKENSDPEPAGNFFSSSEKQDDKAFNAIEAVVHQEQTLVNGSTIKLRLISDVSVNGHRIAKDGFVYGTVALNNERLEITIKFIRDAQSVYPVKLQVFDMDGMQGIYIPGAITRDVAKQSTDNAVQSLAFNSLDPSIGAQAASAGIETAKTFLSKKVKLVRVHVKAGYKILLKEIN